MSRLIQVIKAVDALKRKPEGYEYQSFFGQYDLWQFTAITDDRTCEVCMDKDTRFYTGNELRTEFMDLMIEDGDTILARVHPNCRCELHRIIEPTHYIPITERKQE